MKRVPPIFRNFYVVGTVLFLVWMTVLDQNDYISRYRLTAKLSSLEDEREYYHEKIKEVQRDHDELFGDNESLEKFAREKYLMKKETEDIYLVVKE